MNIRTSALIKYSYDPSHRGACYNVNGKFMNNGEFMEIAVKSVYGMKAEKDADSRFDVTSDMPAYDASIKSSKATLTTVALGNTYDEIVDNYFRQTASKLFIYAYAIDDTLYSVEMNATEFADFLKNFSYIQTASSKSGSAKVVRLRATTNKMIAWFESHI